MSETKHTPTDRPWSAVKIHAVEVAGWWSIQDGPYYEDTDLLDEDRCPEAAANAAHIVHCVNSFEEREALLKEMREGLEDAKHQIEYMHKKFQRTGSGNQFLSRIETLLSKHTS